MQFIPAVPTPLQLSCAGSTGGDHITQFRDVPPLNEHLLIWLAPSAVK